MKIVSSMMARTQDMEQEPGSAPGARRRVGYRIASQRLAMLDAQGLVILQLESRYLK